MLKVADALDRALEASAKILLVTPLLMILLQFLFVLQVYVFSIGSIQLQESLQYINALMFLGGAGYTALHDGHVRVDLFYSKLSKKRKSLVDFLGTLGLLIPFLILVWWSALPFVIDSWAIKETSVETSGLPFVYILKTMILLFTLSLSLHAASLLIRTFKTLRSDA